VRAPFSVPPPAPCPSWSSYGPRVRVQVPRHQEGYYHLAVVCPHAHRSSMLPRVARGPLALQEGAIPGEGGASVFRQRADAVSLPACDVAASVRAPLQRRVATPSVCAHDQATVSWLQPLSCPDRWPLHPPPPPSPHKLRIAAAQESVPERPGRAPTTACPGA
jgi:hypothetical protein